VAPRQHECHNAGGQCRHENWKRYAKTLHRMGNLVAHQRDADGRNQAKPSQVVLDQKVKRHNRRNERTTDINCENGAGPIDRDL